MFNTKKAKIRRRNDDISVILGLRVGRNLIARAPRPRRQPAQPARRGGWGIVSSSPVTRDWFQPQMDSVIPQEFFVNPTSPAAVTSKYWNSSVSPEQEKVLADVGNIETEASSSSVTTVTATSEITFLDPSKIREAVTKARISAGNDENRYIQSPWLSRNPTTSDFAQTSSKLSVLEIIEVLSNPLSVPSESNPQEFMF